VAEQKLVKIVADVLDKQIVDRSGRRMGRVDGIVLQVGGDDRPPRIVRIESGAVVQANRLHPTLGRWMKSISRRWGLRRGAVTRIAWSKLRIGDLELKADLDAHRTPALAWEHWLHDHFVRRLPGAGKLKE
jgi:hypothetical protein